MSQLLQEAVGELQKLPGIGRRTALRLAMHLLRMEEASVDDMTAAIARFRHDIKHCTRCTRPSVSSSRSLMSSRLKIPTNIAGCIMSWEVSSPRCRALPPPT